MGAERPRRVGAHGLQRDDVLTPCGGTGPTAGTDDGLWADLFQPDGEFGAVIEGIDGLLATDDFDVSPELANEAVHERHTEPGAAFAGGTDAAMTFTDIEQMF